MSARLEERSRQGGERLDIEFRRLARDHDLIHRVDSGDVSYGYDAEDGLWSVHLNDLHEMEDPIFVLDLLRLFKHKVRISMNTGSPGVEGGWDIYDPETGWDSMFGAGFGLCS